MQLTNLDQIVNRWLLESGYSIHFYAEGLFHAATALRELSLDTLKIVNTRQIPVNDYYAIDLPEDFVDEVMVGVPFGGKFQPVAKNDSLTPLRAADSTGPYVQYETTTAQNTVTVGYLPYGIWYYNYNEYGEPTGRFFGANGGAVMNGYKVVRERRQIQLTDTFTSDDVLLMYISDGQSLDAASQIDVRAFAAITAFIQWKRSPNRANDFSPEGQHYYNQRRLLRSRLNDLTTTDIINILRSSYTATIKN